MTKSEGDPQAGILDWGKVAFGLIICCAGAAGLGYVASEALGLNSECVPVAAAIVTAMIYSYFVPKQF